jgi:transcriptional regulator with XRE-family HTH domain
VKIIKTKHQLVQLMVKQKWTQERLAALLDLTTRQIRRYVSGDAPIPRTVELSINLLIQEGK